MKLIGNEEAIGYLYEGLTMIGHHAYELLISAYSYKTVKLNQDQIPQLK